MGDDAVWGLVWLVYVGLGGLWVLSNLAVKRAMSEARGSFYSERQPGNSGRDFVTPALWIAGLVALLIAHGSGVFPPVAALVLIGCAALAWVIVWGALKFMPSSLRKPARYWAAGTATWCACVAAWVFVFYNGASDAEQGFWIAVLPPLITALGYLLFRWARR